MAQDVSVVVDDLKVRFTVSLSEMKSSSLLILPFRLLIPVKIFIG